jgi:hypothetical protein
MFPEQNCFRNHALLKVTLGSQCEITYCLANMHVLSVRKCRSSRGFSPNEECNVSLGLPAAWYGRPLVVA